MAESAAWDLNAANAAKFKGFRVQGLGFRAQQEILGVCSGLGFLFRV